MKFIALNFLVTSVSFVLSFLIALNLTPNTYVNYNSWKQAIPLLSKILTMNSQVILSLLGKKNQKLLGIPFLLKFLRQNLNLIIFMLLGLTLTILTFGAKFEELFGDSVFLLPLVLLLSPIFVYLSAALISQGRALLFWFINGFWAIGLGLSYLNGGGAEVILPFFTICLIYVCLRYLPSEPIPSDVKSLSVKCWSKESIYGALEFCLTLITIQVIRFILSDSSQVAAFDFVFSIVFVGSAFVTNFYGFKYFSKDANYMKLFSLRHQLLMLFPIPLILFLTLLGNGLIEVIYRDIGLGQYYVEEIIVCVVIAETLRFISALFQYDIMAARKNRPLLVSGLAHPIFPLLFGLFFGGVSLGVPLLIFGSVVKMFICGWLSWNVRAYLSDDDKKINKMYQKNSV